MGDNFKPISKAQMKEMLLLDDWGKVISQGLPLIASWGGPLIAKLYDRYLADKLPNSLKELISELRGGDEGF